MLVYTTQMPISRSCKEKEFVQLVIDWIHSNQVQMICRHIWGKDAPILEDIVWDGTSNHIVLGNETLSLTIQRAYRVIAARSAVMIQVGKYMLDFVYSLGDHYLTMSVHGEGQPIDGEHFLPVLARSFASWIIEMNVGGYDNNLRIACTPRRVDNPARHIQKLLDGDSESKIPIALVTLSKSGEAPLDVTDLALSAVGLAHVFMVPSDDGKINDSLSRWGGNKDRMAHIIIFFPTDVYGQKKPVWIPIDKHGHKAIEACVQALQDHSKMRPMESLQTWDGVTIALLQEQMKALQSPTAVSQSVALGSPQFSKSETIVAEEPVHEKEDLYTEVDIEDCDLDGEEVESDSMPVESMSGECGEMLVQSMKEGTKAGVFDVMRMTQIEAGMTLMRLLRFHHKDVHERLFSTNPVRKKSILREMKPKKVGYFTMLEKLEELMKRLSIIWVRKEAYDLVDGELVPLRAIRSEDHMLPWDIEVVERPDTIENPSVFALAQALEASGSMDVYTTYARGVAVLVAHEERMAEEEAKQQREEEERLEQQRLEEERKAKLQRQRAEELRKAQEAEEEKAYELSPEEIKALVEKVKELEEENESLREAYTALEDKNETLLAENNSLHKENKQLHIDYDRLLEELDGHTDPDAPDTVQTPHGVAYTDEQGNLYMSKVGRLFDGDDSDEDMPEGDFILLRGEEKDLYPHEVRDLVLDMLADYKKLCAPNSRREHVIQDLLEANHFKNSIRKRREELKNKIRTYRKMDSSFESYLRSIGFQVTGKGKHYKWTYFDDPRYVITAGKTISDGWCAGLNIYSVIERLML